MTIINDFTYNKNEKKISDSVLTHNGLSWFYDEHKIIYLGVPKTASTSIRTYLKNTNNCLNLNQIPEDKIDYKVFTIIREPIQRFVAGVLETFRRPDSPNNLYSLRIVNNIGDMINQYITILENDGFTDPHIAPQVHFITDKNGTMFKIDTILLFENLKSEFNDMCEKYNIPPSLPHKWANSDGRRGRILSHIDSNENIKNRIIKLYEEDIELYTKVKNNGK